MDQVKNQKRIQILIWMVVLVVCFQYLAGRFTIMVDEQEGLAKCLPYTVYIVDVHDKDIERGDIFVFDGSYLAPFFNESHRIAKIAAGMPGDTLSVSAEGVSVEGVSYGKLSDHVLGKLGKSANEVIREEQVPSLHIAALGTLPRSYDSRYWGYVRKADVIGKAYAIW